MIIACEGADGHGKTTLAHKLSEILGIPYYHSGGRQDKSTLAALEDVISKSPQGLIVDRFPIISEVIYSNVLKREPTINHADCANLLAMPFRIIFCLTSEANISDVVKEHKSPEFRKEVTDMRGQIKDAYISYFRDSPADFNYDWRVNDLDTLIRKLKDSICVV